MIERPKHCFKVRQKADRNQLSQLHIVQQTKKQGTINIKPSSRKRVQIESVKGS